MPANLPPQYFEAERKYREAKSPEEKIAALKRMLAIMPKHKGTTRLQGDLKKRISKHKAELRDAKKKAKRGFSPIVEREGAGQVVLLGEPNTGKSSFLAALTNAKPEIADYPYTTRLPLPGMLPFEDIQIQLVDLPPLCGQSSPPWIYDVIRRADVCLLFTDLGSEDPVLQIQNLLDELAEKKIEFACGALSPSGKVAAVIATKSDLPGAEKAELELLGKYRGSFEIAFVSNVTLSGLQGIGGMLFRLLNVVRVYTKEPGEKPDLENPYVLPRGTTVLGLASTIHRDFSNKLKYARIWGSEKYDGQTVDRDHILEDGDVIELHI